MFVTLFIQQPLTYAQKTSEIMHPMIQIDTALNGL